jgi:DNA polymerase-3 subunit epsilon
MKKIATQVFLRTIKRVMSATKSALQGRTFAIVDTETNGTSPNYNQIIEIGILRIEDGVLVDSYRTLIKPARMLPEFISSMTGITNADLEHAPTFEEVAIPIKEILKGATLVAHNARFDYSFIKNEFRRVETQFNAKTLCTVKLSRNLFPKYAHHALDDVIARHKIPCQNRHRAFDDALVLWEFLQILDKTFVPDVLEHALTKAMGLETLPSGANRALVAHLPHAPGVYVFYGKEKEVLYVGKSIDIKTRVLSHFSNDHRSAKELRMLEEVTDIGYTQTTGELSALFLESKLIKELNPVYNRALRKVKQLALMLLRKDERGYRTADIVYRGKIEQEDLPNLLGVFRTIKQAKEFLEIAIREHALCPKILGLEKTNGACFQHQLENCKGACVGKETPAFYNARFTDLFRQRKIKTWPYPGPVVIKDEVDEYDGVAYVIDNWCLVKTFSYVGSETTEHENVAIEFDYDAYKILTRYFVKNEGRRNITLYKPQTYPAYEERVIG